MSVELPTLNKYKYNAIQYSKKIKGYFFMGFYGGGQISAAEKNFLSTKTLMFW